MITAESHFKQTFRESPSHLVTSPGRVNLIGEHTDYNLLPVLPMTISQSIRFAIRPNSDSIIRLKNLNDAFPPTEIHLSPSLQAHPGHWTNYCRAAIHKILQHHTITDLRGFDAVIESDLPPASGLSSSSALVIGTCLSLLTASNINWPAPVIAERMRIAEQFVGTAGGGMDQAIISLGKPDSALLIEFDPLTSTSAPLPPDIDIFILNSGRKAEKTGAARYHYNRRSLECTFGVEILNHHRPAGTPPWQSLRDVYQYYTTTNTPYPEALQLLPTPGQSSPAALRELIGSETFDAICHQKKLNPAEITKWLPDNQLKIRPRVDHVLHEAQRVYQFHNALIKQDLNVINTLVTASQDSLDNLYEVTTPEINQLVTLAQISGATSARITGAGFGGSILAIVPREKSPSFPDQLQNRGFPSHQIIHARSNGPARVTKY